MARSKAPVTLAEVRKDAGDRAVREAVAELMRAHQNNVSHAAAACGMDPSQFRREAKRAGYTWPTLPRTPSTE